MLRTSWSRLANTAIRSLMHRLAQHSGFGPASRARRIRRGYDCCSSISVAAEVLEVRQLLFAPTAAPDSYSVVHDHTLTVTSSNSVLNNDSNFGGGTMTAVLYSNPSHGSLTAFNSDGTYTYVPSFHYAGSETFQYRAHNNDGYSSPATVTISVNNTAPSAAADSYVIYKDSLTVSAAAGVLANDSDADGDSLTASLVSGPSHGSLSLSANGAFTYTPTVGYFGADSFSYSASDGIASTNATVSLTDTDPFSAQTNTPNTPFNDYTSYGPFAASQLTGGVQITSPLSPGGVQTTSPLSPGGRGVGGEGAQGGRNLVYSSIASDVKPIIEVEATYQANGVSGIPTPDSFKVDLTFGGLSASTLYFNNTGLSTSGGPTIRFADQIDASSLATGHYQYQMTVTSYYSSTSATRVYTGYQDIVNRQTSEFGKGWSLAEQDGLAVQTGGVLWYGGSGGAAWFASNGSGGYTSPAGPLNSSTLVLNGGGTYTLTDKYGDAANFSSAGLLTSKVDTNGNTTSYAYSSGKIASITDQFSRTTTFNYTSGLVSSITDIAGQTTSLAHSSTNLTSITAPIPAGGVAGPVTSYAYTGNLLTSITDPLSHVTSLTYSYGDRISQATYADSNTTSFAPAEMKGLVNTTTGTGTTSSTPATPYLPGSIANNSTLTDSLSHQSSIQVDMFGDVLSYNDPLNLTTTNVYNANGQITQMTQPSPAPVTSYQYDSHGNLTQLTHPDSSTDLWTYGTSGGSLNRPLTHTDQRGKTTTYTYDSAGNVLTATDALSNVTTMTYTTIGLLATLTEPNPATGLATGGLVTSYTHDTDGRVTRITNPDSTHKDFTYDSEDHVLTSTDELGRVTTLAYDGDGRVVAQTAPNASTGGATGGPVAYLAYDAASNLTSETSPLGYVTSFAYNSRNWQTTITLPPPTTGGTSPVITIGYNAVGWKTSVMDPLGNVTTSAFDADGRVTSVTAPDPDGSGPLSAPVTGYTYDNLGRITVVTDPNSHTTSYGYNSMNEVTSVTDALSKVTSYTFDATGHTLTVIAPVPATGVAAPVTTYTYSDLGQLLTTTDPLGNVTTNAFDHDGRLITVTAPVPATGISAPVTSYTWDSLSRLSTKTDPLANVTTYGYDNAGELTSVTAPVPATGVAAPVTNYAYDGDGRLITVTDPNSHATGYAYNADNQVTSVTDAMGNVTSYAFDHDGRKTSRTDPVPATGIAAPVTSYTYNADSQVTGVTDPRGNTTAYAYDNDGRITSVTRPAASGSGAGPVTSYAYDAASNITGVTDALSNQTVYAYNADNKLTSVTQPDPDGSGPLTSPVTSYSYDNMGRLLVVTDPLSHTTSYAYTADSQVASVTDGLGNVTSYAYDHLGRETTRTDPVPATGIAAPVTTFAYDGASQLTSTTDPLSNVTSNVFDHDGRLISTTDGMSQTTSFGYDAASNQTAQTDPLSNTTTTAFNGDNQVITVTAPVPATGISAPVTTYTYDHLGRETSVTDPIGHVTSYQFDANSNTTGVTDANSNTTSYTFDNLNRVTGTTDANSHSASYSYNVLGAVTSQTDKNGRVSNFTYDNLGRMTQEQWMSSGTAIYTATYAYNAAGALNSASDNNSAYAYTYNADNKVTQVDNSGTSTGPHVVLNVGYDNLQRETSLSATVASTLDFLNNYSYDAASNMTKITQQSQTGGNSVAPKVVNLTFNADAQYTAINRYANLTATQLVATSTYGYNADGAMTSLSHDKGGTNLQSYTWTYDHMGRLTADTIGTASDSFSYDAASEVTAATHSGGGNESYSYDSNGNRTNTGYSTGTNNQLSSDGTYNYLYDNAGNLTKKTTISTSAYVTYTWDYRNRLTDVQAYNSSNVLQSHEHYVFDVFNRLIERQVDPTGGGTYTTTQAFIYSGSNVILVYNGSGTLTDRLLVTPSPLGGEGRGEGVLADENGSGTVSWMLTDREGTTVDVVQYNSGTNTTTVVDHLVYSSFGKITSQTNSAFQPLFAYTGQMWDAAASLYYYHARWYDPRTGRFISQDPAGFAAGDANLYRYVGNSPTNFIDPSGRKGSSLTDSNGQIVASGLTGPVAGGVMQYGNFYANVVGPGSGTSTNNGGEPPGVVGSFFAGIGDTFMSGEAFDSAAGAIDAIATGTVEGVTLGFVSPPSLIGPVYGHDEAYGNGRVVGNVAVFVGSVAATVYSVMQLSRLLAAQSLLTISRGGMMLAGANGAMVIGGSTFTVTLNGAVIIRTAAGIITLVGGTLSTGSSARTLFMGYGSYTNTHQSTTTYSGKGDKSRMNESASEKAAEHGDPVTKQDHTPAKSDRQSFIDEQNRIEANGGPGGNTYNKINSPGKNYRDGP